MIGLLFSGQGAQKTGLTQDMYDFLPNYRKTIDTAATKLNLDLPALLFDESKQTELAQTKYAQPAIMTISYGIYQILQENIAFTKFGLGLSLGEYSALAASNYLTFESALHLIKKRGELMQIVSEQTPSAMIAVMKSSQSDVQTIIEQVKCYGQISIANINLPNQIVVGGEMAAVNVAQEHLIAKGMHVIPLKVSGAFHTPLMQPVQAELQEKLSKVAWRQGQFPVYSTTTQKVFTPSNLTSNLTNQLVSTTYFAKTLSEHTENLHAVVEIGPGRTLISFARKMIAGIKTYRTDSLDELQKTVSALEKID